MRLNVAIAHFSGAALSQVSAFQMVSVRKPTIKKSTLLDDGEPFSVPVIQRTVLSPYFVGSHSRQRDGDISSRRKQTHLLMFNSKSNDENDDTDDMSIEELYEVALREDEEWYNTFVRDVLGEGDVTLSQSDVNEGNDTVISDENPQEQKQANGDTEQKWKVNGEKKDSRDGNVDANKEGNVVAKVDETPSVTEVKGNMEESDSQTQPERSTPEEDETTLIQYIDMYDNVQRIPMSVLSRLGYAMNDVAKLQAGVLELIVEDEMPMPKGGVPRRWMVDGREEREIKILKKKARERSRSRTDDKNRKKARADGRDSNDEGDRRSLNSRSRSEREDQRSRRNGSSRKPQKRRSGVGLDGRDKKSSLWMDVPTFKQYLRREADLRLSILGPDWEDWVKGESDWRLNLYKNWLDIVDNGVGDDIFEEISYAPPSERQRDRPSRLEKGRRASGDAPGNSSSQRQRETPQDRRMRTSERPRRADRRSSSRGQSSSSRGSVAGQNFSGGPSVRDRSRNRNRQQMSSIDDDMSRSIRPRGSRSPASRMDDYDINFEGEEAEQRVFQKRRMNGKTYFDDDDDDEDVDEILRAAGLSSQSYPDKKQSFNEENDYLDDDDKEEEDGDVNEILRAAGLPINSRPERRRRGRDTDVDHYDIMENGRRRAGSNGSSRSRSRNRNRRPSRGTTRDPRYDKY